MHTLFGNVKQLVSGLVLNSNERILHEWKCKTRRFEFLGDYTVSLVMLLLYATVQSLNFFFPHLYFATIVIVCEYG